MGNHFEELSQGKRFNFGANWKNFLEKVNEERIHEAEHSLKEMLSVKDLTGMRFLDIGSGSGLFSLAAKRLGAKVHSFDYDPKSVGCTKELKNRYYADDDNWVIEEGSALDKKYLESLGKFDIVYSWGVLHHTGNMKSALLNSMIPLSKQGRIFISIYNDQGPMSKFWIRVKKTYCSNLAGKIFITAIFVPMFSLQSIFISCMKYKNPFGSFLYYKKKRGMSLYNDWIDWLGGYPFEVARPEEIFCIYKKCGFILENLKTTNRLGCNQFVFCKHMEIV